LLTCRSSGDESLHVEWLASSCNLIVADRKISDVVLYALLHVFRERKPHCSVCYMAIKLLEHAAKVIEREFEKRIKRMVDDLQFRFRPGKRTTNALFVLRYPGKVWKQKKDSVCTAKMHFIQ